MKVPADKETVKKLEALRDRALKLVAELQIIEMETRKIVEDGAAELGIAAVVQAYDFNTQEYIVGDAPNIATQAGRDAMAQALGVDSVEGIIET